MHLIFSEASAEKPGSGGGRWLVPVNATQNRISDLNLTKICLKETYLSVRRLTTPPDDRPLLAPERSHNARAEDLETGSVPAVK